MLDLETRKRIDNARDILVGKVPDPKSQVEQITIALIYKFMDDMDKEAEELGGRATFFKGEFAKYSWSNIFDPKLGGYELINLYGEAITKMNQNKNIPQLFRDIFKNAFLPYRDPETLKSFLKEINDFHYDHSERLGDAFEYLLSVLGVQGDAGSLRTPRHIIDFIVKVIAPKKNETILDPACGTAGFLISAYKHIRDQNTDKRKGNQLTPDDRKRLMNSIVGHDISPDMVRLSLVNMYLHGFQNPKIYEYDTLTSDERWNETYDIILANPPFMTPKGGIRPHKRFSIQANRSEVLFVDYIMEHIATDGRAGVIVPEGIIFQSANAYKALRKALVENGYLYAVVSLPAGVFNPYSGVKTSVLLMDRTLAKKAKDILFVKIENDGFDLGAQRRESDKSDLPEALKILQAYRECVRKGKDFNVGADLCVCPDLITGQQQKGNHIGIAPTGKQTTKTGEHTDSPLKELFHIVPKTKIAESGDYSLTGDRYRENIVYAHKDWPMVELGSVCDLIGGGTPSKANEEYWTNGNIKWISAKHFTDDFLFDSDQKITGRAVKESSTNVIPENTVVLVSRVSVGKIAILKDKFAINQDITALAIRDSKLIDSYFLFSLLKRMAKYLATSSQGLGVKGLTREFIKRIKLPLPPLSVQKEIVAEIEGYQKIIDGAMQVVENYKPRINVDESWEMVELGEICDLIGGGTPSKENRNYWIDGKIKWISAKHFKGDFLCESDQKITEAAVIDSSTKVIPANTIIMVSRVSLGKIAITKDRFAINQDITALQIKNKGVDTNFLFHLLKGMSTHFEESGQGLGVKGLTREFIRQIKIPLPPLKIQKRIVAQIEEEQKLVEANKKLIEIFEEKIKAKIAEVWGEEAPSETGGEILMAAEELATYGK